MRKIIRMSSIIMLIAVMLLCGYNLWEMSKPYMAEAQIKEELAPYRDGRVIDLQKDVNKDIIAWLTIPGTHIDYPVVQANDNDYYLRRDLKEKYALAGTIFMDYRCAKDFTDFNSIIYGHNMKNGSMFGDLTLFANEDFFDSYQTGTLYLADKEYALDFFAYLVVRSDNNIIYNKSVDKDLLYKYVRENARIYREPASDGNIVTLSTCAYEFTNARMVLLATIRDVSGQSL